MPVLLSYQSFPIQIIFLFYYKNYSVDWLTAALYLGRPLLFYFVVAVLVLPRLERAMEAACHYTALLILRTVVVRTSSTTSSYLSKKQWHSTIKTNH